jgi:hypothetical protein
MRLKLKKGVILRLNQVWDEWLFVPMFGTPLFETKKPISSQMSQEARHPADKGTVYLLKRE